MSEESESEEDKIMRIVEEIRQDPHRRTEFQIARWRKTYDWFFERYPRLADMCITSDQFNPHIVRFMLKQKHQVDRNHLTQHNASVSVGEMLAQSYIYPNVDGRSK